jgi:LDH2 family malate/lactate/ureidoglycolate dehydrogenase
MEKVRAAAIGTVSDLVDFGTEAYVGAGVPPTDARKAAEAIVDADLHGTVTHGLKNLRNYVQNILDGKINPKPNMRDVGGGLSARVITADNGLGHVAGHVGMEKAIELAKQYGVGTVFVRDSNHYGASGYWARLPLRHNMIGFSFTTASPSVAPWGGKQGQVGNNPPAWAVPSRTTTDTNLPASEADSLFIDIALSVVAGNRLDIFKRRGEPAPEGWALDGEGEPTTNPDIRAINGTYAPLGNYKGSGMAIALSAITSFLAGAAFDDQRAAPTGSTNHWFAAYDIAQFTDPERLAEEVRGARSRIQQNPPRRGFERVYAPGDIENENERNYTRDGIPLEQFTLDELEWVAEHTGARLPVAMQTRR